MKNTIIKFAIAAILGLSVIAPIATFATHYTSKQEEVEAKIETKILQSLNADSMYNNIKSLAKTPRVAGTQQEDAAVAFIKKQFDSYGYKAKVQAFTFNDYTAPHTIGLEVERFSVKLDPQALEYSVSGKVTGEVIDAGLGQKKDLEQMDLTGKIALLQRGVISFKEKMLNVAAKGAIGVIFFNNEPGNIMGSLGEPHEGFVPSVLLTQTEGETMISHIKKYPRAVASLKIEGAKSEKNTSHNVIATKKPNVSQKAKETHDIVVISAHHDSVAGAPGANDDASGTAMTLELARVMKAIPTHTEIRFITFGAEELGLLGSTHYVEQLSKGEISRIVANFNLDMVGSKDAGDLILQTVDNKPNLVTELAQEASTDLNGEPTPYNQGENSDHVPFAKAGIPAALFIHNPAEPWYHKPEDSIDKISKEKLQDVSEIVTLAVMNQTRREYYAK
ncbi:M28 family peptidase [Paenisporosarcina quisquiliarum]|uniref:M28 family peptidase n=1 Tax=Paenisporosarcina quisquiliarum TaxID=365346 RepID=A0A9X3LJP1_9BACL|nr:M28 family peptidase [Paenisporosarcina quisquiliarum]MCZ8537759.1 M28 family peptidase [Paenisporosarcina quisquiliarum]